MSRNFLCNQWLRPVTSQTTLKHYTGRTPGYVQQQKKLDGYLWVKYWEGAWMSYRRHVLIYLRAWWPWRAAAWKGRASQELGTSENVEVFLQRQVFTTQSHRMPPLQKLGIVGCAAKERWRQSTQDVFRQRHLQSRLLPVSMYHNKRNAKRLEGYKRLEGALIGLAARKNCSTVMACRHGAFASLLNFT